MVGWGIRDNIQKNNIGKRIGMNKGKAMGISNGKILSSFGTWHEQVPLQGHGRLGRFLLFICANILIPNKNTFLVGNKRIELLHPASQAGAPPLS
jgi:hypothetical protein